MSDLLKVFLFASGLLFTLSVMTLLVRKKMSEKQSIVWLAGTFVILLISAIPEALDQLARQVGVDYPPSLLFLVCILMLILVVLYQSIQIFTLNEKIKELAQHIAVSQYKDKIAPEKPAER